MVQNKKKKIHFAWFVLLGLSIMIGLARGGMGNSAGQFLKPVSDELGIGMGDLTLYFSISAIVTMIFLPIAGKLIAKYDIRLLLVGGIILDAGSFAMYGLMDSVWGWYIFTIPMAIGAVFVVQISGPILINRWFKKHNGLALGIMMAAVGLFGAVVQPLVGSLIVSEGWRNTYSILGISVMVIIIPIVLIMIRNSPKQKGLLPYGMDYQSEEVTSSNEKGDVDIQNTGVTFAVAKKSSAFYALVFYFFFITAIGSFTQHIAPYSIGLGYDSQFAGNVMGVFMVGMLVASLAFGFLSDKVGAKNTAIFALFIGLIAIFLLIFFSENKTVFTIAIGTFGFLTASVGTMGPLLTTALFGNKEYAQIYSAAAVGLAVAAVLALPGYGFIYDFTGSYTIVLYTIVAMLVISMLCVIIAFKGKKKLEENGSWN